MLAFDQSEINGKPLVRVGRKATAPRILRGAELPGSWFSREIGNKKIIISVDVMWGSLSICGAHFDAPRKRYAQAFCHHPSFRVL